jgi:uridine phosphorylase
MAYPNFKNKHLEKSLFSPEDYFRKKHLKKLSKKPEKYILVYYPYLLNFFKRKYKPKRIDINAYITIYQYKDIAVVRMTGAGAPNAAMVMEDLIALGGKDFLNIGSAGGLHDFGFFLCDKAIRDEGTSYHYLPHGKYLYPDKHLTEKLAKAMEKHKLKFQKGCTWTIDAPYRETVTEIKHYRNEGVKTVEMEASALFAVASIRKVKIASAFMVSDVLGNEKWNPQFNAKHVKQKLKKLVDVAVDCLSK